MLWARLDIRWVLFLIGWALWLGDLSAQADSTKTKAPTIFQQLQEEGIEHITLAYEIDSVILGKLNQTRYDGLISIETGARTLENLRVKVSARGNFRRRECDFPPIKLDFNKHDLEDLDLRKTDEYKLVTHCLLGRDSFQLVYKEYMLYQMYGMLTSKSFRTLLFPITYHNARTGEKIESFGILIESDKELEYRLGGKWCSCYNTSRDGIDAYQHELVAMFQYMIGNRDMSIAKLHNVKLIETNAPRMMPIPYDFDFSLFVRAEYAFPGLDKGRVVKRLYQGFERNKKVMKRVFAKYVSTKKRYLEYIQTFEPLNAKSRSQSLSFIEDFYRDLDKRRYKMDYRLH